MEISDDLVERFEKIQKKGVELGYFDKIPIEAEIEALLDREITKLEQESISWGKDEENEKKGEGKN